MKDAQKIALIASFLLRYPDEQWYNELPEWREDAQSVGHPQLRQGLLEFFDYVEESDKKEFEDQYVRTFDFSQNTTMYLSTYELQGTGEQAEELVKFKAFFLENFPFPYSHHKPHVSTECEYLLSPEILIQIHWIGKSTHH